MGDTMLYLSDSLMQSKEKLCWSEDTEWGSWRMSPVEPRRKQQRPHDGLCFSHDWAQKTPVTLSKPCIELQHFGGQLLWEVPSMWWAVWVPVGRRRLLETSPLASRGSDVNVITVHTNLLHKKREMLSNVLEWQLILYSQLTEIMKSKVTDAWWEHKM